MDDKTPFSKVLVANRGEIALRILHSARKLGLATVAVYSDADKNALYVTLADQAVCIGGAQPAQSYLNIDRIIQAARQTGADAVHPGYGFLAENAEFAEACGQAGIVFVGPSAQAIRDMGDKARAKALMEQAGVPCVPGYRGDDQTAGTLENEAAKIGFPVMIKALAGGGGRGMRLVGEQGDFANQLARATSEAKAAFGDERVLLERAFVNPRHIEFQVVADRHGNAVHCGERDCSVQRRHQKLIEEAPSPVISARQRAHMGQVSVNAALAIGYEGVGTFEYLLDDAGDFYFMEMNTRLQVEHPVTEAVTGLDLVELQLRIAAGDELPVSQQDITFSGHAIEARICAEDPAAGFLPQSGTLAYQRFPGQVRVDHGLADNTDIPPQYDSMIAKVIAHGATREDARRRLVAGLTETALLGVRTNRSFLAACLVHPVFARGGATTGFIAENRETLLPDMSGAEAQGAMVAAALMRAGAPTRLVHGFATPIRLGRDGSVHDPRVTVAACGACSVSMPGQPDLRFRLMSECRGQVSFELNGVVHSAIFIRTPDGPVVQFDGQTFDFRDLTFDPAVSGDGARGDGRVRATMNGTVVAVDVAPGDTVQAGQKVLVLEAMKMEHAHVTAVAGTVSAVHVRVGAQAVARSVLIEVDPTG